MPRFQNHGDTTLSDDNDEDEYDVDESMLMHRVQGFAPAPATHMQPATAQPAKRFRAMSEESATSEAFAMRGRIEAAAAAEPMIPPDPAMEALRRRRRPNATAQAISPDDQKPRGPPGWHVRRVANEAALREQNWYKLVELVVGQTGGRIEDILQFTPPTRAKKLPYGGWAPPVIVTTPPKQQKTAVAADDDDDDDVVVEDEPLPASPLPSTPIRKGRRQPSNGTPPPNVRPLRFTTDTGKSAGDALRELHRDAEQLLDNADGITDEDLMQLERRRRALRILQETSDAYTEDEIAELDVFLNPRYVGQLQLACDLLRAELPATLGAATVQGLENSPDMRSFYAMIVAALYCRGQYVAGRRLLASDYKRYSDGMRYALRQFQFARIARDGTVVCDTDARQTSAARRDAMAPWCSEPGGYATQANGGGGGNDEFAQALLSLPGFGPVPSTRHRSSFRNFM